ncbi:MULTISPECIES: hypothetical protein [unclassified Rhizobium]|uniref:hypothetical protein n=1 Tax=unclassified Rhizobium TaxID=2613769 RepID=UPI00288967FA|nr:MULTISPECIES: hypothetical protein [unclassified Rhizobium]
MPDAPNLRQRLDGAYDVFARYRRPLVLHASPLRDPEMLLKQLTAKPIRLLDVEDVQEYASAALTTVGTGEDYKHFLPRLLDLATESGAVEPEMIALKLKKAEWRAWPKNEQQSLEEVFVHACVDAFKQHTDDYLAGKWLVSLAILNIDIGGLWTDVLATNDECCALQIADLLLSDNLFASDPSERAYWEDVSETTVNETRSWLLSEETRSLLLCVSFRTRSKDGWLLEKAIARQEELVQQRLQ